MSGGSTNSATPRLAQRAIALNSQAVRLVAEHRNDEALKTLRRAIALSPRSFRLHRNLSIVYENMKRMDEALESALTAVEFAPQEPSALKQLCGLQLLTRRDSDALGCYERLRAIAPLDTLSQTFYGVALMRSGDFDSAVQVLESASKTPLVTSSTVNALGICYFNMERYESAVAAFKKAVEIEPDQASIRFNLAISQLLVMNREGALSQYRLLKRDAPELADQLYRILFRDMVVYAGDLKP